jgi:hypothetical protein
MGLIVSPQREVRNASNMGSVIDSNNDGGQLKYNKDCTIHRKV